MRKYVHQILVCGGRDYADRAHVWATMDAVALLYGGDIMLVTGACPTGADCFAEQWAKAREQIYVGFPAEWTKYGRPAGFKRNAEMAAVTNPVAVVAFRGNRGTLNMLGLARNMTDPVPIQYHQSSYQTESFGNEILS